MSVVTVDLPQHLFETSSGPFSLKPFRGSSASSLAPSRMQFGPTIESLWTFTMNAAPMSRTATIEMEAWFANIGHRDWAFRAYDPLRQLPLGIGNGYRPGNAEILFEDALEAENSFCSDFRIRTGGTSALVKTEAPRGANTIIIKGIDPALAGQAVLKRGDHFSVGLPGCMNLHMAMNHAVANSDGEARIDFMAPLWKRALINDVVEFYRPTGRFGLYANDGNGTVELVRSSGPLSTGSLSAIEFPWQEEAE